MSTSQTATPPLPLKHPAKYLGKRVVVIVGGGFAGLQAAKVLANHKNIHVILVDERNHHLFQPLLYQVATAGLNPGDIAVPIRAQFSKVKNIDVYKLPVSAVNLDKKTVTVPNGEIEYDYLIMACGAQHSYFANPEWEEFAPGLKTLEQATEIRRRILSAFEKAESELDANRQRAFLTFVVIGGGPTGVEVAGAISDISTTVLKHDFRRIDPSQAKVILLEAGPRVLAQFAPELSRQTQRDLYDIGVEVRTNARVTSIDKYGVHVGGEFIPSRTKIWAAGVRASKMTFIPEIPRDKAGRITIQKDLSVAGYPNVFVLGDMASFETEPGKFLPGVATVAIQQGEHAGHQIINSIYKQPRLPFIYKDKGKMATIGKFRAVVETSKFQMTGYFAWATWLIVHLFYLIGFKNRLSVMTQWAWHYVFAKGGARLITEKGWKLKQ